MSLTLKLPSLAIVLVPSLSLLQSPLLQSRMCSLVTLRILCRCRKCRIRWPLGQCVVMLLASMLTRCYLRNLTVARVRVILRLMLCGITSLALPSRSLVWCGNLCVSDKLVRVRCKLAPFGVRLIKARKCRLLAGRLVLQALVRVVSRRVLTYLLPGPLVGKFPSLMCGPRDPVRPLVMSCVLLVPLSLSNVQHSVASLLR